MHHTGIDIISERVFGLLEGLAPELTYHCAAHTADVVKQSERIAIEEAVHHHDLYLLKVAALYHDTGFLYTYAHHEEKGCEIFLEDCSRFHFSSWEKDLVTSIIMATRVPQQPHTLLERIICDADLDYLGRTDFFRISAELKKEFMHYGIVSDEEDWQHMQINFLTNHHYHTATSQLLREPVKQQNRLTILSEG